MGFCDYRQTICQPGEGRHPVADLDGELERGGFDPCTIGGERQFRGIIGLGKSSVTGAETFQRLRQLSMDLSISTRL